MATLPTFALAVLAGAFIALGAMFATTVVAGAADVVPFGVARLLAGLVFCLGLILVVVAGAELFTGNNLIAMAWAERKVSAARLLRNWTIVYVGNLVGALGTVAARVLRAASTSSATARSGRARWRSPTPSRGSGSGARWRSGSCATRSSASRSGSPTAPAR